MGNQPVKKFQMWKAGDPNACWLWPGSGNQPNVSVNGKSMTASRFMWEVYNGRRVPPGLNVCHTCDNPRCVNPSHLWIGTQKENMQDAKSKGRLIPSDKPPWWVEKLKKFKEGKARERAQLIVRIRELEKP